MEGLQKKIAGDWFDIRENGENVFDIEEYFNPSPDDLKGLIKDIRLSVEEGILEYKRTVMLPIFSFLESLKYDSRGLEQLQTQAIKLSSLIYTMLIQRLLCRGAIPLRKEKLSVQVRGEQDIKEIVSELNDRIKKEPDLSKHPAVKNIFMQMNIYKKELEEMKKLSPNIPPEKASAFFANFKNRFNQITGSIQENYTVLLKEEQERLHEKRLTNPLEGYDLVPLAKMCMAQAQEAAKVRSTLNFAEKEGYRTREYLVNLIEEKDTILRPFHSEAEYFQRMEPSPKRMAGLAKTFGQEIIVILERQLKRIEGSSPASPGDD